VRGHDQRDALVGRIALIFAITCGVVVAATVLMLALPAIRERVGAERVAAAYSEGDRIDLEPATYAAKSRTVFFFTRFSCGACQASKPVMAGIVADLMKRVDTQVILVTPEALPEEEQLFALELGIDRSQIYRTDLLRLRLRQVPTMVVADSSGRILMAREGLLTESDRADVVQLSGNPTARQP